MATVSTPTAVPAVESEIRSEKELNGSLDELWDRELPCASVNHSTDPVTHDPTQLATMRGTPPCGSTLNVCKKYGELIQRLAWEAPLWQRVSCLCGKKHFAWSFRFVNI